MIRPPPISPLFPYTTLFRSVLRAVVPVRRRRGDLAGDPAAGESGADRPVVRRDHRPRPRSEEHTSELQSLTNLVCRLLLEKKKHKLQHGRPKLIAPADRPHE